MTAPSAPTAAGCDKSQLQDFFGSVASGAAAGGAASAPVRLNRSAAAFVMHRPSSEQVLVDEHVRSGPHRPTATRCFSGPLPSCSTVPTWMQSGIGRQTWPAPQFRSSWQTEASQNE